MNAGIVTVDEVRGVEGLNKRGGKADELREPQNITGKPKVAGADDEPADDDVPPPPKKKPAPVALDAEGRMRAIVTQSAERLQRKEITAARKEAVKHAQDQAAFDAWATAFYEGHASLVALTLQLKPWTAELTASRSAMT